MSDITQDTADSVAKLPASKQNNNMNESGELDPSQITDDAIKEEIKDTPNNGETQDLIDEIDKDKPMNEGVNEEESKKSIDIIYKLEYHLIHHFLYFFINF